MREQGGTVTLSRVLTLVIVTEDGAVPRTRSRRPTRASFEHPCRVIVVARGAKRGVAAAGRADPGRRRRRRQRGDRAAAVRPLADHGASVVMPLLLADSPVVVWWPGEAPEVPAEDPIGALAHRRITDAASAKRPTRELAKRRGHLPPGRHRPRLDPDHPVARAARLGAGPAAAREGHRGDGVAGARGLAVHRPAGRLARPAAALPGHAGARRRPRPACGVHSVTLATPSRADHPGPAARTRPPTLTVANQPERTIALPRRTLRDCLAEELRRLDADEVYAEVLTKGLPLVTRQPARPPGRTPASDTAPAAPPDTQGDAAGDPDGHGATPPAATRRRHRARRPASQRRRGRPRAPDARRTA